MQNGSRTLISLRLRAIGAVCLMAFGGTAVQAEDKIRIPNVFGGKSGAKADIERPAVGLLKEIGDSEEIFHTVYNFFPDKLLPLSPGIPAGIQHDDPLRRIEKRIGEVENSVIGLDNKDKKKDEQIAAHQSQFKGYDNAINKINNNLEEVNDKSKKHNEVLNEIKKSTIKNESDITKIGEINTKIDEIVSKNITDIEHLKLDNVHTKDEFNRIEKNTINQSTKIGEIEKNLYHVKLENKKISNIIYNQSEILNKNENDITKIKGDIINQGNYINGHDQAINEINDGLIGISEIVASQYHIMENNEQNIVENKSAIGSIIEKNEAHDKSIIKNEKAIDKISEKIIDAGIKIAKYDENLSYHEQRIVANESAVRGIQEDAVYYNRNDDGRKSGVVTFNGADKAPVRLSNVATGRNGKDAANVDQLLDAVKYLGGGALVRLDGSISGPTYTIAGKTYDNVGAALSASDRVAVRYVGDENGNPTNRIILSGDGTGMPVSLTNVAPARRSTDAPNFAQVLQLHQASFDYTDQRIGALETSTGRQFAALSGDISRNRQEARGGIASALAAAGLRFDDRPGKGSIATSVGSFKGATAVAAGLGYTTEGGNWRLNAAVSHSFATNDTSWNVGASWTFD